MALLLLLMMQLRPVPDLKELLRPHDKPLVVHAWASWCGPCLAELPEMVAELRKRPVDVLWVNLDEKPEAAARVWKKLGKVRGQAVRAQAAALHPLDEKWEGDLPATWLLGADGKVTVSQHGRSDLPELWKNIDQLGRDQ
jgi:thiol-disulfide isomerase/thioredoxin